MGSSLVGVEVIKSGAGGGALWVPLLFAVAEVSGNDKSVLEVVSSAGSDTSLMSIFPGPFSSTFGCSTISTEDSTKTSSCFPMSLLTIEGSVCIGSLLEL